MFRTVDDRYSEAVARNLSKMNVEKYKGKNKKTKKPYTLQQVKTAMGIRKSDNTHNDELKKKLNIK